MKVTINGKEPEELALGETVVSIMHELKDQGGLDADTIELQEQVYYLREELTHVKASHVAALETLRVRAAGQDQSVAQAMTLLNRAQKAEGERNELHAAFRDATVEIVKQRGEVIALKAAPPQCANGELLAEIGSLKQQMGLIGAALKRAGIEHPEGVWHIGVCDLASRYLEASKPVYGPSPLPVILMNPLFIALNNSKKKLEQTLDCIARNLNLPNPDDASADQVMDAISDLQGQVRKVATLRNIVLRHAPHTRNCVPAFGQPCGCWKSQFMAEADKQ